MMECALMTSPLHLRAKSPSAVLSAKLSAKRALAVLILALLQCSSWRWSGLDILNNSSLQKVENSLSYIGSVNCYCASLK